MTRQAPKTHKILKVSDYHICASYSSVNIPPKEFLAAAKKAKDFEEFVNILGRPEKCPLRILANNIQHADEVVLNGDMIEFVNQDLAHDNETMSEVGIAFHRLLLASAKGKPVHEIIGNHERVILYERRLEALEDEFSNFHFSTSHYRTGNALFIHGDRDLQPHQMADGGYERLKRERARGSIARTVDHIGNIAAPPLLGRVQRPLEIALDGLPLALTPSINGLLRPARQQAKIILHNLHARLGAECEKIQHVFLGHTHVPYNDLVVLWPEMKRKVTLHNGGVAVDYTPTQCNPMMISMQADKVVRVEQLGAHKSNVAGLG